MKPFSSISHFSLIVILVLAFACKNQKFTINGEKGYQIVIPAQADSLTLKAAHELQFYLAKLPGANLPVVSENEYKGDKGIYIGHTNYAKAQNINFSQLETDGYLYKQHQQNFIIAGGSGKGSLYGIYDFLEAAGFRKYTYEYTYAPEVNAITFPKDTVVNPQIKFREVYFNDAYHADFFDWHKLNYHMDSWGLFVHTFNTLVPHQKYGETHPEYYSLWEGQRQTGDGGQLCLSNPEVFEILVSNLRKEMAKKPHMKYWSVSQGDNENPCCCEACKKLNEKYGGDPYRHSGSIIYFVNKVAREFPDKTISTLAYRHSREAPENIELEPNVNIMLCSIESTREKPISETDPEFAKALEDWGKLAKSIIVWDYTVQFHNLISPFPNLHTLKPNVKLFTDNNVTEMFEQGDRCTVKGGNMVELKTYLLAKLLWNPDADDEAIIQEFVQNYYGEAGTYIQQYIDTMREALLASGQELEIFGSPIDARDTYLKAEMMEKYKSLLNQAEEAVADAPELLFRVQRAKLPVMFAELEIAGTEMDTPRSMYTKAADGRYVVKPEFKKLVHEFVEGCNAQEIVILNERTTPPDLYLEAFTRIFNKMDELDSVISFRKKVIPVTTPDLKPIEALTDGVFASFETYQHPIDWVGFKQKHMEFILDLGEIRPVNSVNIDFLNGRTLWTSIFLPEYVSYATSVDGKNYAEPVKVLSPVDPNKAESYTEEYCVHPFYADMNARKARYIKVFAKNIMECPSWHMNTGTPAWLYADEITVK